MLDRLDKERGADVFGRGSIPVIYQAVGRGYYLHCDFDTVN